MFTVPTIGLAPTKLIQAIAIKHIEITSCKLKPTSAIRHGPFV